MPRAVTCAIGGEKHVCRPRVFNPVAQSQPMQKAQRKCKSVTNLRFNFNYSLSNCDNHSFIGQHAFKVI